METQQAAQTIQHNLDQVLQAITLASRRVGRPPSDVRLVVVTKGQPLDVVRAAIVAGVCCLGENYAEEAEFKIHALAGIPAIEWHMIGHIQSRKAQLVAELFNVVHAVDSLKLADRLDRFSTQANRSLPVLLECNTSGEESKFGFPAWNESRWSELVPIVQHISLLPGLQLRGLMTMAPFLPDPEGARPFFRRLRRLRDYLNRENQRLTLEELSMGMSADFEIAVEEGATWVRIGQAILGPRLGSH